MNLLDIILGRPRCPYCGKLLSKRPGHKAKCEHCRAPILVRSGGAFGRSRLVTEAQATEIESLRRAKQSAAQRKADRESLAFTRQAQARQRAELLRQRDVYTHVKIEAFCLRGEVCPVCRAEADRFVPTGRARFPPFKGCTCEGGCRCSVAPFLDDEVPR